MLCKFLIFIPVLNVPNDATMIAFFCFSTILLIASLSDVAVFPDTKNILRRSSALSLINFER